MQRLQVGRWTKRELRQKSQLDEQLRAQWNSLGQPKQETLDDEIDAIVQDFEAEVRKALKDAVRSANVRMQSMLDQYGDAIIISALNSNGVDGDNVCGYRVAADDGERAQNVHGWARGDIHLHWSWRPVESRWRYLPTSDRSRSEWSRSADGQQGPDENDFKF